MFHWWVVYWIYNWHTLFCAHLHICGCFTSMVLIFNFSASPAPTHRHTVTHHHVLRAHKIVCVLFVKISIRFRCIIYFFCSSVIWANSGRILSASRTTQSVVKLGHGIRVLCKHCRWAVWEIVSVIPEYCLFGEGSLQCVTVIIVYHISRFHC